ncbi:MAG: glycosyltransferase family 4 protein [bacterium]
METQVRGLARRQAARGDDVCVITATPGPGDARGRSTEQRDGVRIERVTARLPADIPVHPRTSAHVRDLLRDQPVDVVHIHAGAISPFAWGALGAATAMGLPVVVTVHSMWGPLARAGLGGGDRVLGWSAAGVVMTAVSGVAASAVAEALHCEVGVVPNGIDPEEWRSHDGHGLARPPGLRAVSVLRLAPRKRVGALLRATANAARTAGPEHPISLTVIGDGPERSRAERLARRLGLDARFTGRLTKDEIRERFADADVFVQASVRESFGIAALEARTFGLPVVARSQTGTGEFIENGVNGLLAPDDPGLSGALVALARDPGLIERMRRTNTGTLPRQTWDHVLEEAAGFYRRALSANT